MPEESALPFRQPMPLPGSTAASSSASGNGGGDSSGRTRHEQQQQQQQQPQQQQEDQEDKEDCNRWSARQSNLSPSPGRNSSFLPLDAEDDDIYGSGTPWRLQLRDGLKKRIMTVINVWTCTLVITVLLALIFRALQPTEEPSISIVLYEWQLDPKNQSMMTLSYLNLDLRGIGRFTLELPPTTLALREPPPSSPLFEDTSPSSRQRVVPLREEVQEEDGPDVLSHVHIPSWRLMLGHNGVMVSASAPSDPFPFSPEALPEVVLTGVFHGVVTVFASLPCRISLSCRIKTSLVNVERPLCTSEYKPYIKKGYI